MNKPVEINITEAPKPWSQCSGEDCAHPSHKKPISEFIKEAREALEALKIVADAKDNESTKYPFWIIVGQYFGIGNRFLDGVWFSRESAQNYLDAKRHNYGPKAFVYCASGHVSRDYRMLYEASKSIESSNYDGKS